MSKENNNTKQMIVYAPIEREKSKKTFWLRVGTAFWNKDESINVYLDALPLGGKLQLRQKTENKPSSEDGESS